MVLEAGYPNTKGFRKVVKATILVKKKPGMSDADFIEYYNHKHAQMAAPVVQRNNVITYSIVRGPVLFFSQFQSRHPAIRIVGVAATFFRISDGQFPILQIFHLHLFGVSKILKSH
jgi:hypothetical protein